MQGADSNLDSQFPSNIVFGRVTFSGSLILFLHQKYFLNYISHSFVAKEALCLFQPSWHVRNEIIDLCISYPHKVGEFLDECLYSNELPLQNDESRYP